MADELPDAAAVVAALTSIPPRALPIGWILKESRSQPNHYFYFQPETGVCTWLEPQPQADSEAAVAAPAESVTVTAETNTDVDNSENKSSEEPVNTTSNTNTNKRLLDESAAPPTSSSKKQKQEKPKQVRILHILKKHKGSRRPSSWRQPETITISKDEAAVLLQELVEVLQESKDSPEELRATFEELARTESDCSSAKRGGDLGFFGPKKMQPTFEKASFDLKLGEMSEIIETSSGVHVLLRIG
jgi:NIMA-interacting peptidyl-prolyl cis-trans isomerase 1